MGKGLQWPWGRPLAWARGCEALPKSPSGPVTQPHCQEGGLLGTKPQEVSLANRSRLAQSHPSWKPHFQRLECVGCKEGV